MTQLATAEMSITAPHLVPRGSFDMKTSRIVTAISFGIIVFSQGCSGKFAQIGSDQDASVTGGTSGVGGSTAVTCLYSNVHYAAGASFKSSDGCNTCSCPSNGQIASTKRV